MKNIPVRKIKVPANEPIFSESFGIRKVEYVLEGKDMSQDVHRHDFFFILIITKGNGTHTIDFVPYRVKDNSIFFMRPGQVHELSLKAGSTGYLLEFKSDFYDQQDRSTQQLMRKLSNMNFCQLDSTKIKKMLSICSDVFQEYKDRQQGYAEVIKANLEIFFIELLRHRHNKPTSINKEKQYMQEKLEAFQELLDTHITKKKQVSDYADMLNQSVYQLNSITKNLLDKTPSDLINEQIILESKRYLLATSNQVNQIAYHLGYEDVSYFIRFFKKHTGYSPEAFRNNSK